MIWRSATIEEVKKILQDDLSRCDSEQLNVFNKYTVEPHFSRVVRHGKAENVVVVARKGNEVIYWEDVEDGFNVSPVSSEGTILQHWCNQDDLGTALNTWIEGRRSSI
jgi:hypothetical protein